MTYDDERVVALLKESAPERVPDAPGRVDAVRRLAGRQRRAVQAQVLGAAASLVLVVAAVAAVSRPGGGREVRPVADPVRTMVAAFLAQETVHYEIGVSVGPQVMRGALRVDGTAWYETRPDGEEERVLGAVHYRPAEAGEELPAGKRWVRDSHTFLDPLSHQVVALVMRLPQGVRDVRFVRTTTVRGISVAEYALTLPPGVFPLSGEYAAPTTLALDAVGRPRRLAVTVGREGERYEVRYDLFGYGDPVVVEAPPESEVVNLADAKRPFARTTLWGCAAGAVRRDVVETCARTYERTVGDVTCTVTWVSREQWSYRCSDGTSGEA